TVSEPVVSVTLRLQNRTKGSGPPPAAATSSDAWEFADGADDIGGNLEVLSDAQGQVEAGAVLSALQVSDRLIMDAEVIGEFATGDRALGSGHRDAVVTGLCHFRSATPLPGPFLAAARHGPARLASGPSRQQFRCQDETDERPPPED